MMLVGDVQAVHCVQYYERFFAEDLIAYSILFPSKQAHSLSRKPQEVHAKVKNSAKSMLHTEKSCTSIGEFGYIYNLSTLLSHFNIGCTGELVPRPVCCLAF